MIDEEVHQRVKPNKLNDLLEPYREAALSTTSGGK